MKMTGSSGQRICCAISNLKASDNLHKYAVISLPRHKRSPNTMIQPNSDFWSIFSEDYEDTLHHCLLISEDTKKHPSIHSDKTFDIKK